MGDHPIKVWVPDDLYEEAINKVNRTAGLTMSRLVRRGFDLWLARVEAEAFEGEDWQGLRVKKGAGEPYPERTGELSTGRPVGESYHSPSVGHKAVTFRPGPLRDRIYNAAYWRSEYLSRIAVEAIEAALR